MSLLKRRYLSRGLAMLALVGIVCQAEPAVTTTIGVKQLPPDRQRELLRDGLSAFDQATSAATDDPARAEQLYRSCVAAFETLAEHGVCNPALEYNLGNAYFRLGKLGRAIQHYRRAQRYAPVDSAISMNLEYARNRVEPYIAPSGTQQLLNRLMFWTNYSSVQTRFQLAALASIAGWLGLAVWLKWRSTALLVLACAAFLLGLANAGSVAWQLHDESTQPAGVVVDGEYVCRLGAGEGYDPALSQPLGPGVELRILSQRGDWFEVRLNDDKVGWLPACAVERI